MAWRGWLPLQPCRFWSRRRARSVPLAERVPRHGIELLVAGGLAYTVGIVFFALGYGFGYAYALWHAFVVAGSLWHFFAVLIYAR